MFCRCIISRIFQSLRKNNCKIFLWGELFTMIKLIFKLALALNKHNLRIKTDYTIKISVRDTNVNSLKKNQELAVIDIDTRENIVKLKLSEILEEAPMDSVLYNVSREIKNISKNIKDGKIRLEYLIQNSGKAIEPIITKADKDAPRQRGEVVRDSRHWRADGKEYQYYDFHNVDAFDAEYDASKNIRDQVIFNVVVTDLEFLEFE